MSLTKVTYSMIAGAPINVLDFGAVGDGVADDTVAIQTAINRGNWTYSTNTVVTESTATPVTVYFPHGVYRITSKLRLAPGVQLIGETGGIHARTAENTTLSRKGSTIYCDYAGETDYAIDTSGYAGASHPTASAGTRVDNWAATGADQAGDIISYCSGIRIQNLMIQAAPGRLLRGVNLGGAPMCVIDNVYIFGFIVGLRLGASWGGQLSNLRIEGPRTWRGLVLGTDNNNTTLTNVYISGQGSNPLAYTPPGGSTIGDAYWTGYEGTPATYGGTTRADLERSHGIWCKYAYCNGSGITIESVGVGIGLRDSNEDFDGIYMEGISSVLVADYGGLGQGSTLDFSMVKSSASADVISGVDSNTIVNLPKSYEMAATITGKNVRSWSNPYYATVPVVTGRNKTGSDTEPSFGAHYYNDGVLITEDREASRTLSGVAYKHEDASGAIVDRRSGTEFRWQYRGVDLMKLVGNSTPYLQIGSGVKIDSAAGNAGYLSLSSTVYMGNTSKTVALNTAAFYSDDDNVTDLGRSSTRWAVVYAGTGTINTSDAREKQQVRELADAERAVAVRLKGLIRAFKFNDAVQKKGDGARIHFGVLAQDVAAAFEAEGLDPHRYAMFCYDEWQDEPEVLDEEGKVVMCARTAGNRYGIRYEELLAFIIAAI